MSPRMQSTLGLVMTAACVASASSAWTIARRDAGRRRDDFDTAMIERLDRLIAVSAATSTPHANTAGANSPAPAEFVNLQVRLVQERPDGPPAEGFTVEFQDVLASPGVPLKVVAGPTGVVDLGLVRAGRHSFDVKSPWKSRVHSEFDVRIGPTMQTELVLCEAGPPVEGDVTIQVDWPEDLRSEKAGLICRVDSSYPEFGDWTWYGGEGWVMLRDVLVRPNGEMDLYSELSYSVSEDSSTRGVNAQLGPPTERVSCIGAVQECTVIAVAIVEKPEAQPGATAFRVVDFPGETVQRLTLDRRGTNRFEIKLTELMRDRIRALLRDAAREQAAVPDDLASEEVIN